MIVYLFKILRIHIKLLNMNDFIEPSSSQWVWYLSPVVLVRKKGRSTYSCCSSHCVDYQWDNVTIVKDFYPSAFLNRWLSWYFVHFLLVQHLEPCQWIKDGRLGVACISLRHAFWTVHCCASILSGKNLMEGVGQCWLDFHKRCVTFILMTSLEIHWPLKLN